MAVNDVAVYEDLGPDPYTVVRELGRGVGSITQLVKRGEDSALYVRKRISAELANIEAWQALEQVSHPLVPHVYEQCWRDGTYEVVYDYVSGESLDSFIKRNGVLNERYAASIMLDVADAAAALHAAGIVHRDISPNNVIIDLKGRAHLTDLGIARVVEAGQSRDTTQLGTWGFAAPEQYGFAQTDARSDVYAMGRLLAYACTGLMPEVVSNTFDDEEYGLSTLSPGIVSVIKTACAFEPSARFQSAGAFATALSVCMGDMTVPEAKSLPAKTQDTPSETTHGSLILRILGRIAFVAWVVAAFFVILGALFSLLEPGTSKEPVGSFLTGVALAGLCVYCAIQTRLALKHRGVYEQQKGRVPALLRSYLWAIMIFALVFLLLVVVTVAAQPPSS